jgi:AcrR family transcriptional regulator
VEATAHDVRLVEAAIRCIEKYGLAKTYIDDIAKEAGLSRPTAYRVFKSRKELLEQVAMRSISGFSRRMKAKLRRYPSFSEALVQGIPASLEMATKDKIFMTTLQALGDEGMERYFLNPKAPNFAFTLDAWAETIARARAAGEIREGVTDHELITLFCSANCIFLLRDDMTREDRANLLTKFLLPAVIPERVLRTLGWMLTRP